MIAFLESLSRLPGVEFVLLISHDGVPIAHAGGTSESAREESLAALTAAWLNEVGQAVAPLGWRAPDRICLRAARGTLVLRHSESASLLVCLGRETSPEDVRLSMDGTLARIERARTGRAHVDHSPASASPTAGAAQISEPTSPIPYREDSPPVEEGVHPAAHPDHPPGN